MMPDPHRRRHAGCARTSRTERLLYCTTSAPAIRRLLSSEIVHLRCDTICHCPATRHIIVALRDIHRLQEVLRGCVCLRDRVPSNFLRPIWFPRTRSKHPSREPIASASTAHDSIRARPIGFSCSRSPQAVLLLGSSATLVSTPQPTRASQHTGSSIYTAERNSHRHRFRGP